MAISIKLFACRVVQLCRPPPAPAESAARAAHTNRSFRATSSASSTSLSFLRSTGLCLGVAVADLVNPAVRAVVAFDIVVMARVHVVPIDDDTLAHPARSGC